MLKLNICNWKRILILLVIFMGVLIAATTVSADAVTLTATAKINATGGAYMRSTPSTSSEKNKIRLLKDNKSIVINKEVFTSTKSVGKKKVWYYITVSGKKGYIRSDCVDSIKYSPVKGSTTDTINYRIGPNTAYTSEGTIKSKTTVSRCLKAYLKGNSQVWYKIRKDSKYYYVSGEYVKNYVEPSEEPAFTITGLTYPTKIWQGIPFYLHGTITCTMPMERVRVRVLRVVSDEKTTEEFKAENKAVNANSFDISTVDSQIKFGSLKKGSYIYRIDAYVDGKWKNNIVKKSFTVKVIPSGKWGDIIADKAKELAWPLNTPKSTYTFNGGSATEAFNTAFNDVFPTHASWGNKNTKVGADCGVFVATVIRASGYDPDFVYNLTGSNSLFLKMPQDTSKWIQVFSYTKPEENTDDNTNVVIDQSLLKNGDIIMYHKKSGQHILIYVKEDSKGYMVEAANSDDSYYGRIAEVSSKITNVTDKGYLDYYIYRAAK